MSDNSAYRSAQRMKFLWCAMMLVWLAGLVYGLWWVWPLFERMTVSADLVMAVVWLIVGTAAWIVALNLGLQRYGRRHR
jgi:hypothetical protein